MTRAGRLAIVTVILAAAACGSATPHQSAITFDPANSPVKVDTPALRALKAAAHIQPCPVSGVGTEGTPGGLPDITLPCLGGGRSVDLASLRGPLVLNFWAQTCGPCREESPLLQRFAAAANGKVRVLGVDFYDPRPSYAIEFAKDLGLTYPQVADPMAVTKAPLRIAGLPMTFFIAPSGRIAYTQVGAITSLAQLWQLVEQHLGESALAGSSS